MKVDDVGYDWKRCNICFDGQARTIPEKPLVSPTAAPMKECSLRLNFRTELHMIIDQGYLLLQKSLAANSV
jgi:hypothetical protein